jgi:hypothetical protein
MKKRAVGAGCVEHFGGDKSSPSDQLKRTPLLAYADCGVCFFIVW